jgi:hypothetical protein
MVHTSHTYVLNVRHTQKQLEAAEVAKLEAAEVAKLEAEKQLEEKAEAEKLEVAKAAKAPHTHTSHTYVLNVRHTHTHRSSWRPPRPRAPPRSRPRRTDEMTPAGGTRAPTSADAAPATSTLV